MPAHPHTILKLLKNGVTKIYVSVLQCLLVLDKGNKPRVLEKLNAIRCFSLPTGNSFLKTHRSDSTLVKAALRAWRTAVHFPDAEKDHLSPPLQSGQGPS